MKSVASSQPTVNTQPAQTPIYVEVPTRGLVESYILCLPLGWLGLHHFYLKRYGWGTLYLCTFGLLGWGWFIDLLRLPCLVSDINKELREKAIGHPLPPRKRLDDAYILVVPFGWLGLHHFYLNRPCWGVLYMCTFGLLGVGWLVDIIRMPCLVKSVNKELMHKNLQIYAPTAAGVSLPPPGHTNHHITVHVYDNLPPSSIPHSPGDPSAYQNQPPTVEYPQNPAYTSPPPPPYEGQPGSGQYGSTSHAPPPHSVYDNPTFSSESEKAKSESDEKRGLP
ncbi:uncharacterized protein LOC144350005 [Saccoglossus kowalevskii]